MTGKKRRRKPGLLWRVLFGSNGPTKAELKKLLRLSFTNTFVVPVRDPATGRVRNQRMRIEPDGKIREVKAPAKKKRTAAKKATSRRTVSKPSKPSRASKPGSTQRRRQTGTAASAVQHGHAEPMSKRFLQNPDGTMAGSRKQKPVTYAQAQQEYAKAMKNAAAASKRAEQLLGWDPPPRRR